MKQFEDTNAKVAVPDQLFTPLHGVRLTGGLLRDVFDNNIRFTQRLEMDRMRYWFDVKRGITPSAERYPGHFEDNLKGQTASQYLMSAGNVLRWEDHGTLRRGMEEILDFIEATAEEDGFLMPIDKRQFAIREYPHYVRIWLTYGLIAAARGGAIRAFPLLRRWQDWFNRCPDLPVIRYLELAFQGVVASPSVYFSEIGCDQDMTVCRTYYEETWRLAQFIAREKDAVHIRRQPGYEPHPHGSELEAFEGYLDLYRYSGAPYLLNAVLGCWELYKRDWQHPGGGIVMIEASPDAYPGCRFIYKDQKYNELCCSSFWLHLNQRLHRLFPDEEKYVFEMEQSLYNVAIANQSGDSDIRYLAILDEHKRGPVRLNHCCSGVGTRIFASLPEYLFTMTQDTLSCDLYADAVLDWDTGRQIVQVRESSAYPAAGQVRLLFDMAEPQSFTLRIRVPHYAPADVPILVNGSEYLSCKPGSYAVIRRQWQPGDRVELDIPMVFQLHPYTGACEVPGFDRCAFTCGPLLMAVLGERNSEKGIVLSGRPDSFVSRLSPGSRPLHFVYRDADGTRYPVVPYLEIEQEAFTCFPLFRQA
ncbi:MAG: hypothetical protein GX112_07030 [Clostridiaceae bacterium]|nr:hypothetical protein [Clostridiaceae bacterium]